MDKLILIVLGLGLFILALGDEGGDDAQAGGTAPMTPPTIATRPAYVTGAPSPAPAPFVPVNPIPPASALHGKVIDDRFQPDG